MPSITNGTTASNGNGNSQKALHNVLHIIDSRTGQYQAIPIKKNAISANELKSFKAPEDVDHPEYQNEQGLRVLDPGFSNTVVSESRITYIDGLKGEIYYRGYSIQDIVGKKDFTEISHLLIWGKWPTPEEKAKFQQKLNSVPLPDDSVFQVIRSFPFADRKNGSIIGMMIAGLSALQSCDMDAIPAHAAQNLYMGQPERVDEQIVRVMSSLSAITAASYCHHMGITFTPPRTDFSYIENFLLMVGLVDEQTGVPNPRYVNVFERLWATIADHEMTCSTAALLHTASALPDVISCVTSAYCALYGPLHGGAIEVAYKQIQEIGTVDDVPAKLERVRAGKERLYGYGHRVYRVTDPRFTFIRDILDELSAEVSQDPLLRVAFELDRQASQDEYFTSRKLRPNADFYAALAYKALYVVSHFTHPSFLYCLY
ncbi:putative citrate synthase [Rosellinia necatrix]|uniref:Citrate synthase n=1 Tax=Rosellinia necatrix TaxID=77044 RepID=A0A1W2TWD6_ROSNE|nr:putative citrate synthase [Rosellinia necatrix]